MATQNGSYMLDTGGFLIDPATVGWFVPRTNDRTGGMALDIYLRNDPYARFKMFGAEAEAALQWATERNLVATAADVEAAQRQAIGA